MTFRSGLIIVVVVIMVLILLIMNLKNQKHVNAQAKAKAPFPKRTPDEAKDILDDAKENKQWMANDEYNHYRNIAGKEHEAELIEDNKEMDYEKAVGWIELMKEHYYISDKVFKAVDAKRIQINETAIKTPSSNKNTEDARNILETAKDKGEWLSTEQYNHYRNMASLEEEDVFLKELEITEDEVTEEWLRLKKEKYGFVSDKVYKRAKEKIQRADIASGKVEIIEYADGTSVIQTSRLNRDERNRLELFEKAEDLEKTKKTQEAIDIYLTLIEKKSYPYENAYKRLVIIYSKQKDFENEITICNKFLNEHEKGDILYYKERLAKASAKLK